jgi:tRNA(Arg) A34 adenosine deaminase TadA
MLAAMRQQPATTRRRVLRTAGLLLGWLAWRAGAQTLDAAPHRFRRWHAAAVRMRQQALSWGDQPYGAVLVLGDDLLGEGPSRVVQKSDPRAHAEREAIEDAQRRLGRVGQPLPAGTVLVSTSRPCAACQAAAAQAGVSRLVFGSDLQDGGAPRP